MRIVILGAGSIGCFVGGCWQSCGFDVGYYGRHANALDIEANGLTVSDFSGWSRSYSPSGIDYSADPEILAGAHLVAVCVKSTATDEAAELIEHHCSEGTAVLSLQNGISNVEQLRERLPRRRVLAGMVGFNVVRTGPGHWHKSTSGALAADDIEETRMIAAASHGTPASLTVSADMRSIAWGKLLLNLNNAVNALSGFRLRDELMDRGFRRVLAASIREANHVLASSGISPAKITPLPPGLLASFIDTPDWFFNTIGLRLQKIDASARSSMADDFAAGRPTEIDYLNGEILRLAHRHGQSAPLNEKIVELVRQAESGGRKSWSSGDLCAELGI